MTNEKVISDTGLGIAGYKLQLWNRYSGGGRLWGAESENRADGTFRIRRYKSLIQRKLW